MSFLTPKSKNKTQLDFIWSQLAHFDIRQFNFSQKKQKNIQKDNLTDYFKPP